jgi:hypothetical protein
MALWKDGSDTSLFFIYIPFYFSSLTLLNFILHVDSFSPNVTHKGYYVGYLSRDAATVEMIAGDLVFGDVDGGHRSRS